VSGIRFLDGINRKGADSVDRKLIDIAARNYACLLWNHNRKTSPIYFAAAVFFSDSSSSYQLIRAEIPAVFLCDDQLNELQQKRINLWPDQRSSGYAAAFGMWEKSSLS